jgi:molybdopterin molybdotransferase
MVGEAMRSVQHQLDIVTAAFAAPSPARVPLERAFGLLSAEEVAAGCQLPGFDQALVDGFAVRAADLLAGSAASPVVLPLLAVGQAFGEGAFAARVEAGAPVPDGADAVLPLGDAALREEPAIEVATPVHAGAYVRKAGSDVEIGDVVLRRGAIVGPAQIGLLAAAGRQDVLVHPRPRAAVFALGRELVDVGAAPGPGQLFDVNSHALTAAALDAGAEANRAIIERLPGRTLGAAQQRLQQLRREPLPSGDWSPEDDAHLRGSIEEDADWEHHASRRG